MTTELRPIPHFPSYFASDEGHLFRLLPSGRLRRLKASRRKDGYLCAQAKSDDGAWQPRLVHRLVASAWYGEPAGPETVTRHLDHDRSNNSPSNLLFGSPADNASDSERAGRFRKGEAHPNARLTAADVNAIRHALALKVPKKAIAARWNISKFTVRDIERGRTWRESPSSSCGPETPLAI